MNECFSLIWPVPFIPPNSTAPKRNRCSSCREILPASLTQKYPQPVDSLNRKIVEPINPKPNQIGEKLCHTINQYVSFSFFAPLSSAPVAPPKSYRAYSTR